MQFPLDILRECWFLAGPTACGKTELGTEIAESLGAEIVSLDSMALYRDMDIGTAKPTQELRRRVPHHLIDVIDPHQEYSVADYLEAALAACRGIRDRNQTPLFVGGTGLYLRSVLRGVFQGPVADWDFRRRLESESQSTPGWLFRKLQEVDPQAAANLHPNDTRRVIRALEVHHLTGKPLSQQQQQQPLPRDLRPQHVYWLHPPRDWLYKRIDQRVESMITDGLVNEVRQLLSREKPLSRTARQALGYKECIEHLELAVTLTATIEKVKTRTRQFAKRQHTWFRNLEECTAIDITQSATTRELRSRILGG